MFFFIYGKIALKCIILKVLLIVVQTAKRKKIKVKKEYFTLLFVLENNKICDLNLCIYSAKTTP